MTVKIDKGGSLSPFNLTPMIDCVFLLLIFFLVATKLSEEERELDVRLPEASEAVPLVSKPREVVINIDAAGRCFITGRRLTPAELDAALQRAQVNNPGRASAIIRADRRCVWESVVAVMNACNKAKIRDYRVTTLDASERAAQVR